MEDIGSEVNIFTALEFIKYNTSKAETFLQATHNFGIRKTPNTYLGKVTPPLANYQTTNRGGRVLIARSSLLRP